MGDWAETVHMTQAVKLPNAPPPPAELLLTNKRSTISRAKGFGRTTVFDPITQQWADPSRESAAGAARSAIAIAKGNRARDFQLNHAAPFDIFTGRPLAPEPGPKPRRSATDSEGGRVPFNILSAEPLPDALLTVRAARAAEAVRAQGYPTRPLVSHAPSLVRRRVIDIVTNKHREDDEAKSRAEADALAARALRRYWQTRNFDPVLQRYEDPAKDAAYETAARASERVQGVAAAARLPGCLRHTLGRAYDIVGHTERDPPVVELLDSMANRPLRRMTRPASEAGLVERGEAASELAASRRMRSQSVARHVDLSDPHGWDAISSVPTGTRRLGHMLAGGGGAALRGEGEESGNSAVLARRSGSASAWQRIERALEGGGGGGGVRGGVGMGAGAAGALSGWGLET